jgi:hypothetical protein
MRLFLQSGRCTVTVNDIGRAADVAVPTVCASTGGKSLPRNADRRGDPDPVVDATLFQ